MSFTHRYLVPLFDPLESFRTILLERVELAVAERYKKKVDEADEIDQAVWVDRNTARKTFLRRVDDIKRTFKFRLSIGS
jgi:hypothetical protein